MPGYPVRFLKGFTEFEYRRQTVESAWNQVEFVSGYRLHDCIFDCLDLVAAAVFAPDMNGRGDFGTARQLPEPADHRLIADYYIWLPAFFRHIVIDRDSGPERT